MCNGAYSSFDNAATVVESGENPIINITVNEGSGDWLCKMLEKEIEANAKERSEDSDEK